MNPAQTFVNYFRKSYHLSRETNVGETLQNEFLEEFVRFIPEIVVELENCVYTKNPSQFYHKLNNLKFLCEYSDVINRYWYLLRAYSGGLMRLGNKPNLQKATEVYIYYYNKYGGRRVLKDENWFEELRWRFLDQLIDLESEEQLALLMAETFSSLSDFFDIYKKELLEFLYSVKKIM